MNMIMKTSAVFSVVALAACSPEMDNPGGIAGVLPAVDIEGHELHFTAAHAWMKTCWDGTPADVATMMGAFEHVSGDRYLTNHGVSMDIAEGDCTALLEAAVDLSAAGILADGLLNSGDTTTNNLSLDNNVKVDAEAIVN